MKEADVCTKIVNSITNAGHWAFKIPDSIAVPGRTNFSKKKAFDIIAGVHFDLIAIEVKNEESIPRKFHTFYNLFTDGQIKHLTRIDDRLSGHAFAFYCHYKPNRKASLRIHSLYVLEWGSLEKEYELMRDGKKKPLAYSKGGYLIEPFISSVSQTGL